MAIVYITTNLINNKKYIGVDSKNNPKYLGSGILIKNAIKKYGKENFIKEIIEENDNLEFIFEKECYWINYYDAINSDVFYNLSDGGKGGNKLNNKETYEKWLNNSPSLAEYNIKNLKGKTYEEIYGENADIEKEKRKKANLGKIYNEDRRQKASKGLKGNIPWNKGLTKTDERVLKYVNNRTNKAHIKKYVLLTPDNISLIFLGKSNLEKYFKDINLNKNLKQRITVDKLIKEKKLKGYEITVILNRDI